METIKKGLKYWIIIIVVMFVIASLPTLGQYYLQHFVNKALEKSSSSENLVNHRTSYIVPKPGEVVINFKTSLSINEIKTFLEKNGLETVPVNTELTLYLIDESPNEEEKLQQDIQELQIKKIVDSCQIHQRRSGSSSYPVANCLTNLKTPLEQIETSRYIDLNLHVVPGSSALATYVVKVPIGQENNIVAQLVQKPEVLSAIAPK